MKLKRKLLIMIITQKFNKLTVETFAARLKPANLAGIDDIES